MRWYERDDLATWMWALVTFCNLTTQKATKEELLGPEIYWLEDKKIHGCIFHVNKLVILESQNMNKCLSLVYFSSAYRNCPQILESNCVYLYRFLEYTAIESLAMLFLINTVICFLSADVILLIKEIKRHINEDISPVSQLEAVERNQTTVWAELKLKSAFAMLNTDSPPHLKLAGVTWKSLPFKRCGSTEHKWQIVNYRKSGGKLLYWFASLMENREKRPPLFTSTP